VPARRNAFETACRWPPDAACRTMRERRAASARRIRQNAQLYARDDEALRTADRKKKCEQLSEHHRATRLSHCLIAEMTPTQSRPATRLGAAIKRGFASLKTRSAEATPACSLALRA